MVVFLIVYLILGLLVGLAVASHDARERYAPDPLPTVIAVMLFWPGWIIVMVSMYLFWGLNDWLKKIL